MSAVDGERATATISRMLQAAHQQEEPELDISPDQLQALIQGAVAKLRALGS